MTPRRYMHEYRDTDNRDLGDVANAQQARIEATTRRFELLEQRIIELEESQQFMFAILDKVKPGWREG